MTRDGETGRHAARILPTVTYQHIRVETADHVGRLWLDRPEKHNALSADMWEDIPTALAELAGRAGVRVIIVAGRGAAFSAGIDIGMLMGLGSDADSPATRNAHVYAEVKRLQATMTAFADIPQPVIAAVHGYCLGAGVDLITACDIRLASADATFGVRETRMGLVADVGALQRLPRLISPGRVAELVFTGDDIDAREAERIGLVDHVLPDDEALQIAATDLAERIAANSPLVVQGAKAVLRAEAGMSESAALDHVALWNAAFLQSNDLGEAMQAHLERRPPDYTGT